MSTLKVVNIQHPSAASATLILDSSGNLALPAGSASTPALQGPSDTNTGLFFPTADTIAFAEGGTEALRIDSSGRVGIGTSSPSYILEVRQDSSGVPVGINMVDTNASGRSYSIRSDAGQLRFRDVTGSADRVTLDSSGRLGIGTTSPAYNLSIFNNSNNFVHFAATGDAIAGSLIGRASSTDLRIQNSENAAISFQTSNTERARIDGSGRLLVGTSTARSNIARYGADYTPATQLHTNLTGNWDTGLSLINYSTSGYAPVLTLGLSGSNTAGTNALVANGDRMGVITFNGNDGTNFEEGARIEAFVDGAPGNNDMPGRLVFSTTADGASSPTERMRIDNKGSLSIGGNAGTNDWRLFVVSQTTNSSSHAAVIRNSAGTELLFLRSDGIFHTGNAASSPYNNTVVNAANAHIGADYVLYRSTSSIRFKKDVEDLEDQYADAILDCRPVWFRSTASGDSAHPDWGYWGFIAEEVAEIDPRLVFWKTHETAQDADGNQTTVELEEPVIEGVQYDRFVPHLLNLVKRQQQAIEDLQAEVAALKAQ